MHVWSHHSTVCAIPPSSYCNWIKCCVKCGWIRLNFWCNYPVLDAKYFPCSKHFGVIHFSANRIFFVLSAFRQWRIMRWQSARHLMSSPNTHLWQKDLCMNCGGLASDSVSGTFAWNLTRTLETAFHPLTIGTWHSFLTSVHSEVHYRVRVPVNQSWFRASVNVCGSLRLQMIDAQVM